MFKSLGKPSKGAGLILWNKETGAPAEVTLHGDGNVGEGKGINNVLIMLSHSEVHSSLLRLASIKASNIPRTGPDFVVILFSRILVIYAFSNTHLDLIPAHF